MEESFKAFYQQRVYKATGAQRLAAIDFILADMEKEMKSVVDPTLWRSLIEKNDMLQKEKSMIEKQLKRYGNI
jgi:hypothetical protein